MTQFVLNGLNHLNVLNPHPALASFQIEIGIFDFSLFPFVTFHAHRAEHDKIFALVVNHLVDIVLMAAARTDNIKFGGHISHPSQ
jgi:hypothetical protein